MTTDHSQSADAAGDLRAMQAALGLARRGLGAVWPNPAVGCVIVKDRLVVGRGWTQPGGRPHAETEALARAGATAHGATAYVTLEPCCHWGRTPPCTDALIGAGVHRVVVALEDPDHRVAGNGIRTLRDAGIAVELGLCASEAEDLNAGFLSRVQRRRPLVTLKLATSLDGRIATGSGESRWITGPAARHRAHAMRAAHDAIMVGSGTAIADDPELTCRLPGLEHRSPVRIAIDRGLRIPIGARLISGARALPSWIVTAHDAPAAQREALTACGVSVIPVDSAADGHLDLAAALTALAVRGITRVLVEGGGGLAAALLRAGLVDRLAWFHAPLAIGGDGVAALGALGLAALSAAPRFQRVSLETVGDDVLETFRRGA